MRSEDDLLRKLNGYYGTYRGKFLLLKKRVLNKEEYILYDASIAFADWDKKNHPDKYGSFDLTQLEIEKLIGCSEGFVSRYSKGLIKKGFWKKRKDGRTQVVGFELTEIQTLKSITKKNKIVDLQKYIAEMQNGFVNSQVLVTKIQIDTPKGEDDNHMQSLANLQNRSSKADLISSNNGSSLLRTDEEYRKIKEEGHYEMLAIDDMKWIDANVTE